MRGGLLTGEKNLIKLKALNDGATAQHEWVKFIQKTTRID